MDKQRMEKILQNLDVYEAIEHGSVTVQEIRDELRLGKKIDGGKLQRRMVKLKSPQERQIQYPFINVDGEVVSVDKQRLSEYLQEFAGAVGADLVKQEKEFAGDMEAKEKEIAFLKKENKEQQEIIDAQSDRIHDLEDEIRQLKEANRETEVKRKGLVASSIEVGPKKELDEDIFLDDPHKLLDVEKLVTIYGGMLDSFYEEIPTDEEAVMPEELKEKYEPEWREMYMTKYEPGKELTEDNYRSRTMKRIGTKKFFEKRRKDIEEVKEIEKKTGKLFPDCTELMYNPEDTSTIRKRERNRILRNRFETLNRVIESDEYSNQEKLMLFAINGNFRHGFMQYYLEHAAKYCINANFLIYFLQGTNPNVAETYDNMINFLNMFLCPSEFRMKLDLARELIEGKWYITADYNGKKTKFQLVPIEEFNELRERVGLPISQFHYKGDDAAENEKGSGLDAEEEKAAVLDMMHQAAETDRYDYPDDDFEVADEELPFKEGGTK